MGFLFNRKDVPKELPSLIADDLNKEINKEVEKIKNLESDQMPKQEANDTKLYTSISSDNLSLEKLDKSIPHDEPTQVQKLPTVSDEAGYFKDLIKSLTEESVSLEKLDSWCKNKLMSEDVVIQMREYWKKQKPEMLLKNFGGESKVKLLEKIDKLHGLEKEWQDVYLNLLNCENKIREEEKDLKVALSEFVTFYKKSFNPKNKR